MTTPDAMPVIYTYDWVPDFPRGLVRDLRVRWALEELGRPYRVETVPFAPKSADHLAMQPFGQVPILKTATGTLFESGAIVLSLSEEGSALMPAGQRAVVTEWIFAALNSVELSTMPWVRLMLARRLPDIFGPAAPAPMVESAATLMGRRLDGVVRALAGRDWIAGDFSGADILLADVLRLVGMEGGLGDHPALAAYVGRATARPAFRRAHDAQMAHWTAADAARAQVSA